MSAHREFLVSVDTSLEREPAQANASRSTPALGGPNGKREHNDRRDASALGAMAIPGRRGRSAPGARCRSHRPIGSSGMDTPSELRRRTTPTSGGGRCRACEAPDYLYADKPHGRRALLRPRTWRRPRTEMLAGHHHAHPDHTGSDSGVAVRRLVATEALVPGGAANAARRPASELPSNGNRQGMGCRPDRDPEGGVREARQAQTGSAVRTSEVAHRRRRGNHQCELALTRCQTTPKPNYGRLTHPCPRAR
jgi:hypothetical protein